MYYTMVKILFDENIMIVNKKLNYDIFNHYVN